MAMEYGFNYTANNYQPSASSPAASEIFLSSLQTEFLSKS